MNEGFKINKLLIICILIIGITSISGCFNGHGAIHIHEVEDIGNGTYFEITDDELKEYPGLIKSMSYEGCTKSDYGGWDCDLTIEEANWLAYFFEMKQSEYLFSIDMKFENNLNDAIIDAELMNTFESNGFALSEKYSIVERSKRNKSSNSWWVVNKKTNTPEYFIWKTNDELKVYTSRYIECQFTKIGEHYYERFDIGWYD